MASSVGRKIASENSMISVYYIYVSFMDLRDFLKLIA